MTHLLPNPEQNWAHSTCTIEELTKALDDPFITAIEADIVMGYDVNDERNQVQAIMAHPPSWESNLSFKKFFEMSCKDENEDTDGCTKEECFNDISSLIICKHLKLDFKELETVGLVLAYLSHHNTTTQKKKTVFLNADIIRGPGTRLGELSIPCDEFLNQALQFLKADHNRKVQYAFSLGWKADCRSFSGYTEEDIQKMQFLIEDYQLLSHCKGVVLAANARLVSKNPRPFDLILKNYPQIQLLIWTGTGEPPISQRKISMIRKHYDTKGLIHQVGFDCKIASTFASGAFYDSAVNLVGILWNMQNIISRQINYISSKKR